MTQSAIGNRQLEIAKPGFYLLADTVITACGKLPLRLDVCPLCGSGIRPQPGWQWISAIGLFAEQRCRFEQACKGDCPFRKQPFAWPAPMNYSTYRDFFHSGASRAGMVWIPVGRWPDYAPFLLNAVESGIRWPLRALPRGFGVGQTWVLLAHARAMENPDGSRSAAVIGAFRPTDVEYVAGPGDSEDKIARLMKQGIRIMEADAR